MNFIQTEIRRRQNMINRNDGSADRVVLQSGADHLTSRRNCNASELDMDSFFMKEDFENQHWWSGWGAEHSRSSDLHDIIGMHLNWIWVLSLRKKSSRILNEDWLVWR